MQYGIYYMDCRSQLRFLEMTGLLNQNKRPTCLSDISAQLTVLPFWSFIGVLTITKHTSCLVVVTTGRLLRGFGRSPLARELSQCHHICASRCIVFPWVARSPSQQRLELQGWKEKIILWVGFRSNERSHFHSHLLTPNCVPALGRIVLCFGCWLRAYTASCRSQSQPS